MSTTTPPPSFPPADLTGGGQVVTVLVALVVPVVTIVGLIVLIALGKLHASDGLPLIGALAGVHGGAVLTRAAGR